MADADLFRDFFYAIEPIRMRDPLATLLGAMAQEEHDTIEYRFPDVVKMSGHACPTIGSSFVACKHAIHTLYPDRIGERGGMTIEVHGERDDGVFGVIGQVFQFITGASPETGFKGIAGVHRRNNLLCYGNRADSVDHVFDFERVDTKTKCRVTLIFSELPTLSENEEARIDELISKVIWQAANAQDRKQFRDLWMRKVEMIAREERNVGSWLKIEKIEV